MKKTTFPFPLNIQMYKDLADLLYGLGLFIYSTRSLSRRVRSVFMNAYTGMVVILIAALLAFPNRRGLWEFCI